MTQDIEQADDRPDRAPESDGAASARGERRYRFLIAGYALSSYGTFLNMVALNLFVYETTGKALAMGLFMAVRLASGFVAGLVAGGLLARFAAKRVMLWTNVAQAAVMLLLVLAPEGMRTAALMAVSVVVGGCGTLFMVSLRSSIPEMVGDDRRSWANSLSITGRSLAMVAGFASAGVVVSLVGYTAAFVVDMATFVVCAATVALLPIPGGGRGKDARPESEGDSGGDRGKGRTGGRGKPGRWRRPGAFLASAAAPGLGLMVVLRSVDAFGSSSHNAALPVHSAALDTDHPAVFVSAFWCLWALGNVAAQQVIQRYVKRTGRTVGAPGFGYGTCLMSGAFILAFAGFPWAATAVIALAAGAADGLTEVSYTSHLQTLPADLRAHAFGLSATLENLGFGVGMILVAAALDRYSPLAVVGWSHGAAVVVAVVFLIRVSGARGRAAVPAPRSGADRVGPER
ncbi:MFS transporter [Streptomyces sp. NBC_00257]|uniref:MFS transporter n=1 Tax=unclassified Streptomyces TaxID=2593676 RepID=UPI00224F1788|nr:MULTISPECIES: MFS transporter [unclassified Streptomyces]WTB56501.1 MFS transporter [Streptomyces sp. NBC_00826]WTH90615.1 MFS transporter [Streptomyces sp. NBC_00825]WTH99341.1 MFS transporter [Streptomyces sp. NBC_00822]MCX4864775.1 MFS transporter [Streptomyces sp. NBC_00906]MCX4896013.1 MFS transporter [Streptomyces sp. NBC_00892]